MRSAGKGVWDAVFILYVVWPALLLYRVIDKAGGFEALRKGVLRFSRNELFLVLGFGWVFASFLQGITGFGTPIAVVAPLLVAIGVKPVYAVVIPLIGHAWANLFGTLAVAWLGTQQVITFDDEARTATETAVLLWPPNLLAGFTIAWFLGRWAAIRHAWPLILLISLIHGGGQLAVAAWNPVLTALAVAAVAIGPVEDALGQWEIGLPFPEVEPIGQAVIGDAVPASLAIVTFLALSQVMDHSGQTSTLAIGLSEVSPPLVYAFFASWIGLLGSFMTSSNTSSNIIFAPLQDTVAEAEGLRQSTVIAAQHAGGAVGNSISPANVVLGTGAAGIVGREGEILRRVLPYAAASLVLIGAGTLLLGP